MKWTDAEDIGIALSEKFPGIDPLTIRFTDLRERVLALEGFDDDPKASNEAKLESIQMAWLEESTRRAMSVLSMFRPGMRAYLIPLVGGLALVASAFLPWIVIDDVTLTGFPDVFALWIIGLGALAATLATLSMITRKNSRHPLLLVGLAALGILFLSWRIMPSSVDRRVLSRAQAMAIVREYRPDYPSARADRQRHLRRPRRGGCDRGLRIHHRGQAGVAAVCCRGSQ